MPAPLRVTVLDAFAVAPYYTGRLCAALSRQPGLSLTCASPRYGHDPGFFHSLGIHPDAALLDVASRLGPLPAWLRRPLRVAEYLVNLLLLTLRFLFRPPDVLHVQFLPLLARGIPLELALLRLARRAGSLVIVTVHNVLPHESSERSRAAYARLYRLAARLIAHDETAAARLAHEFAIPAERLSVVPHGPMFAAARDVECAEARARLGLPSAGALVLCQGILRPYKGVPVLIDAWREAAAAEPSALLVVAGSASSSYQQELRAHAQRLGLNQRILFDFRFLRVADLELLHQAATLLVYPYLSITTSGALMTGLACHKPIIATRLPAFESLLADGQSALLATPGDAHSLASALLRLLRDPTLRSRLEAESARSAAALPGWDAIARSTAALYHGLATAS